MFYGFPPKHITKLFDELNEVHSSNSDKEERKYFTNSNCNDLDFDKMLFIFNQIIIYYLKVRLQKNNSKNLINFFYTKNKKKKNMLK